MRRDAELMLHVLELGAHIAAQLGVEVGQRLVHQERRGAADHGASERHALALAARKLPGIAVEQRIELHLPRDVLDRRLDLGFRLAAHRQRIGDVGEHRHMRVERVGLEDHRDVAILRQHVGDVAIADADRAGRNLFEARDHAQRRRLAGARGSEQDEELAVLDLEVESLDHLDRAERLVDVLEPHPHRR